MHHGVIISAVGHMAAVLLAVLLTGANPFDSVATEAIAVDIVSPSEVPSDQPQTDAPENPPQPPKESTLDFNFDVALTSQASTQPSAPSPKTGPAQQATQPRAREQRSTSQPASPAGGLQATAKPQPSAPQAAAKPAPAPPPGLPVAMPPPAQETVAEAEPATDPAINVAGLFSMPLTLPDGRLGGGFDAPAIETAKIEPSAVDAFRAHLRTCAALPAGVSPSEKISLVVRVTLKADGTLSAPPTLIEASASPKGPLLLQNLLRGLTQCQPYNMLPADKYREWKNLDMRFTPADMGQG
jgi:hypothetical protein